jgi:hypothetical protein
MSNGLVDAFVIVTPRSPLPAAMIMVMLAIMVALETGCGPSRPALLPAEGVVTLDGKPLANAALVFQPKAGGRPASGRTDATGRFSMGTFAAKDGVLPGEHTVTIMAVEDVGPPPEKGSQSETRWVTPKRYSRADASGLSATVAAGSKMFTFDLTSEEPAKKK